MELIVTGDIHGDFSYLNKLINKKKPDMIWCCGDFGYWPNHSNIKQLSFIKPQDTKILWCDGNHEDHWALRDREKNEIVPNVIYMPRGSIYTLPDNRNVMFFGGAESIDKEIRTEGIDWFREEIITQKDFIDLPDVDIDIFITHTCPLELVDTMKERYTCKDIEPSNIALSELWKIYKPKTWIFGHWHTYLNIQMNGTDFYCLDYPGNGSRWWMYL